MYSFLGPAFDMYAFGVMFYLFFYPREGAPCTIDKFDKSFEALCDCSAKLPADDTDEEPANPCSDNDVIDVMRSREQMIKEGVDATERLFVRTIGPLVLKLVSPNPNERPTAFVVRQNLAEELDSSFDYLEDAASDFKLLESELEILAAKARALKDENVALKAKLAPKNESSTQKKTVHSPEASRMKENVLKDKN